MHPAAAAYFLMMTFVCVLITFAHLPEPHQDWSLLFAAAALCNVALLTQCLLGLWKAFFFRSDATGELQAVLLYRD
jgi:hypothetical protein